MEIILNKDGLAIENYSALVAYAKEQTAVYAGLVVEENAIAGAKRDTADLRKQAKEADRIRIDLKKANEARIREVSDQLLNVAAIFNGAADSIDKQVKVFEQKAKDEKLKTIEAFFDSLPHSELVLFSMVFDSKMLNKTVAMSNIEEVIKEKVKTIETNVAVIKGLKHQFETEMLDTYLQTLDIGRAIQHGDALKDRAEKAKCIEAVSEPPKVERVPVIDLRKKENRTWVIEATADQFESLIKYCEMNGIHYYWQDDPDSIFG